jgi:hypothetical protein
LYLPNAEITLDLEVNEVEVKVLTSLASVVEITTSGLARRHSHTSSSLVQQDLSVDHLVMAIDNDHARSSISYILRQPEQDHKYSWYLRLHLTALH